MEYSEQNIALNSSHSQNAQVTVKTKNDSQSTAEASEALGFVQFKPPPSITRHPPPSIGRDDDIVKLREILDDFLLKTDHLHPTDRITNKILFGPDQKIGNNLLKLIKESERYGAFLPEFPCLHLRKSKITNLCTAYKDAGLLHILKYMRDEETQEWSKLISAEDINKASRYIRRLSIAFHLAFVAKFLSTLDEEERLLAEKNMIHGNLFDRRSKYHDRYLMFVKSGVERNATFALHYDIMQHCDEVSAITFAERIGGPDGYNLLLGSVKSSLPFSFMNGAVSYAPYCTQLLIAHYESGPFYQKMKASLFSTPHKTSKCNIGLDCQREMDHQDVIKAFRSGSSESAVLPRMALIDTFNEIQDTPLRNKKVDESDDNLGLELTDTDKKYILRVAALILRQGGLRTHLSTTPFNVYGKHCEQLSESVLDKNTNEIGIFLIQKYLASSKLCGMTKDRLPAITTLAGPKEYIRRVKTAKGHTVKRTTKYLTTKAKSERDIQEEKRQKLVAKQTKTFDCLSSDMNTCQAVVKPDCSKPKVQKSTGIQKALADLVSTCAASAVSDVTALDSSLIYTKATALPVGCRHAKVATLEFAGVKFKAKAISGTTYIGYVNN
ncbi:MAG: hypothetical protein N0E48_15030, partial [Candidatus Thiodiazotropha endolucinida]|nr:hypothetical protein [Candidatus Thiodiazotropha endolucinida]